MYTQNEIKGFIEKAETLKLVGREYLEFYTLKELQNICTGIGADNFPTEIRNFIDKLNPTFIVSACIHDAMYYRQFNKTLADKTLAKNGTIEAKAKYKWYNPLRYIAIKRAKLFAEICEKFGKNAYIEAGIKAKRGF